MNKFYNKHSRTKPPKCRFKPGQFVRCNTTGELYCIRIIYRTIDDPHNWKFYLEERKDLASPHTPISRLVERLAGEEMNQCIIHYSPVRNYDEIPGVKNFYHYGDSISGMPNQKLLNSFTLISSGELA
jgi:hypothetical protein